MNLQDLSDDALRNKLDQIGKKMSSSSRPTEISMEGERMVYIRELFRRGLGGYPSKRKYRF